MSADGGGLQPGEAVHRDHLHAVAGHIRYFVQLRIAIATPIMGSFFLLSAVQSVAIHL